VVSVDYGHARVEIWHDSDDVWDGPWSSAARTCGLRGCIEYRRSDSRSDSGAATTFLIRRADCDIAERVVVRSNTPAGRDVLISELAV